MNMVDLSIVTLVYQRLIMKWPIEIDGLPIKTSI